VRAWLLVVVAGCYSPHPQTGSPCSDTEPCPATLVCSSSSHSCEVTNGSIDAPLAIDAGDVDACVPSREFCGDGIDQDCDGIDPPCPVNDTPSNPTDIGAGGTFTADLTYAHDDAAGAGSFNCGTAGGRDVYYKIRPTADEVYYIDTFGSDFDTTIRVYHNASCSGLASNGFCRNDACGTLQSQYDGTMTLGDNCVVIRQRTSTETNGHLVVHVERGQRTGGRLTQNATITGTTCGAGLDFNGTCGGAGPNSDYYLATCPGTTTLTATTCNAGSTYDSSLFVTDAGGAELACNDDDLACVSSTASSTVTNVQLSGAHLFWVIVDTQSVAGCGPYSLTTTIN
jgi:hypothetical protein